MRENFNDIIERIRNYYTERKQELYRAAQSVAPSGLIQKYDDFVEYLWEQYGSKFCV